MFGSILFSKTRNKELLNLNPKSIREEDPRSREAVEGLSRRRGFKGVYEGVPNMRWGVQGLGFGFKGFRQGFRVLGFRVCDRGFGLRVCSRGLGFH